VAADAFSAHKTRTAGFVVKDDGLMSAILTRDITTSAADALVAVNLWKDDSFAVKGIRFMGLFQFLLSGF
jgi:hypothetical protein